MTTCDNGYPALSSDECHLWIIPGTNRHFRMARGPAGFLLAHLSLWFDEEVEPLDRGVWDDWGWAWRPIRGSSSDTVLSNHAGYAVDLNATAHPMGVPTLSTFTVSETARIRRRLKYAYGGVIRWGGDYVSRPDAMHFEIVGSPRQVARVARRLRVSPRGVRVRKANPGAWR